MRTYNAENEPGVLYHSLKWGEGYHSDQLFKTMLSDKFFILYMLKLRTLCMIRKHIPVCLEILHFSLHFLVLFVCCFLFRHINIPMYVVLSSFYLFTVMSLESLNGIPWSFKYYSDEKVVKLLQV